MSSVYLQFYSEQKKLTMANATSIFMYPEGVSFKSQTLHPSSPFRLCDNNTPLVLQGAWRESSDLLIEEILGSSPHGVALPGVECEQRWEEIIWIVSVIGRRQVIWRETYG